MAVLLYALAAVAASQFHVGLQKAESKVHGKYGLTWQTWSVDVMVENIAYEKEVFVRYRETDGTWQNAFGGYIESVPNTNRELWRISRHRSISASSGSPGPNGQPTQPRLDLEFAIGYRVAGQEYWDNNNGQNYHVKANEGEMIVPPLVVDKYYASKPRTTSGYRVPGQFFVGVLLKNFAYHKKVEVVYTVDNWHTTHWAQLSYQFGALEGYSYTQYPNAHNVEYWTVSIRDGPLDVQHASEVKFAVRYEVEGNVYWDNRFGENFSVGL